MINQNTPPTQDIVNKLIGLHRDQQFGNAIEEAQEFVQKWPQYGFGWNMLASCFQATGKLDQAADAYQRAIEVEPNNPQSLNNYGNLLRETGQLERSFEILTKAVETDPNFAIAHYNLGISQASLEKYSEAESSFKMAIQIDPQFADAHNYLGNQYRSNNHLMKPSKLIRRHLMRCQTMPKCIIILQTHI